MEKVNVLPDICTGMEIWKDILNENNDYNKISAMNEFINSAPSTDDIQMHTVQHPSDISVSNINLETKNTSNLSSSSESHYSENSCPKISTQNIFIGGADYEPNKTFDEVEYSVLSQQLGSNQTLEGSFECSFSKPTLVETLVPSTNSDSKPKYTTINASVYDELTLSLIHI